MCKPKKTSSSFPPKTGLQTNCVQDSTNIAPAHINTVCQKNDIRAIMLEKRQAILTKELHTLSLQACTHLINHPLWQKAKTVALYTALPAEVDTTPLLKNAWATKKHVYLPKCHNPLVPHMDFVFCPHAHALTTGAFGIQEPCPACCNMHFIAAPNPTIHHTLPHGEVIPALPDIFIIPGVAFDKNGFRLGMGKGYYDRYLPPYKGLAPFIGFALQMQISSVLPHDNFDVPMTMLCTELGLQTL